VGVDCEDAIDAAGLEDARVFGDEVFSVAVMSGEEEVPLAHEDVGCSAENLRVIALAEFGKEDADGLGLEALERASDLAGLVAEFFRGGFHSFACGWRDGATGGVVKDEGDGGGAEVEIFGQHLEADASCGWIGRGLLGHRGRLGPV